MIKKKRFSIILAAVTVIVLLGGFFIGSPISAGNTPTFVIPRAVTYNLYATDGWWVMADGTPIYSYGFIGGRTGETITYLDQADIANPVKTWTVETPTPGPTGQEVVAGHAQFPGPMITCAEGDTVIITLKNLGVIGLPSPPDPNPDPNNPITYTPNNPPNDPHTIHLHAIDVDAANDGVPETSVAAVPANAGSPGAGNVVVYMFTPKIAGTYFYHCHQEADIHVTMGMYGALLVYNRGEAGAASANAGGGPGKSGTLHGFKYDKDYVLLLSETDVRQHLSEAGLESVETGNGPITQTPVGAFNPVDYKPQFWFINQISFPDTIHAGTGNPWPAWIAAHPGYDPMILGSVNSKSGPYGKGQKVLVRLINMGFETQPMHCHGFHPKVLGSDQRTWKWADSPVTGQGLEKNTLTIGSGEEYDLLFDFSTQQVTSTYQKNPTFGDSGGGTETRYDEQTGLPLSNTITPSPTILSPDGQPYIAGPTVKGVGGLPYADPTLTVPGNTPTASPIPLGQDLANSSQIFVYHNHDDYKATNNGVYPGGMFTVIVPTK